MLIFGSFYESDESYRFVPENFSLYKQEFVFKGFIDPLKPISETQINSCPTLLVNEAKETQHFSEILCL